jgi:hypothetical protein
VRSSDGQNGQPNPTHEVFFFLLFFFGGPCGPRTPFSCQAFLTMSKVEGHTTEQYILC